MRRLALVFAAIVAGCGNSSTTVTPSTVGPGDNGGSGGGVTAGSDGGVPLPGGGDTSGGGGAGGTSDGGSGAGGGGLGGADGGVTGGGSDGGMGGGGAACTQPTQQLGAGGTGLAVDATTIYYNRWTSKLGPDTLFAKNKDGSGAERQLAVLDSSGTRAHLLVDGEGVWAVAVGCIQLISTSGAKLRDFGCQNTGFIEFDQDAAAIYANGYDGTILRIAKADGAATTLTGPHMWPHGLAVFGGDVFFGGDGHILRVATTGGAVTEIVHDAAGATHIAADAGHVYWGDVAGRIWSAPTAANATPTQLASVGLGVTLLASDDTRLYWAAQQDATGSYGEHYIDAIEEMNKDGTALRELDARVVGISDLTVDDAWVYWADGGVARHCK